MPGKEVAHPMTYRVIFTKEDKEWTVVAPDVHPAHSWGPNLRSASDHIKEAIALVLDLPAGAERTIALDAEYQVEDLDNSESNVFRIARDARQGLKEAQETADEALRQAIQEGRNHNLSMRDIATMADISYQRVSQIASTL